MGGGVDDSEFCNCPDKFSECFRVSDKQLCLRLLIVSYYKMINNSDFGGQIQHTFCSPTIVQQEWLEEAVFGCSFPDSVNSHIIRNTYMEVV